MKKHYYLFSMALLLLLVITGCTKDEEKPAVEKVELTISAAASLQAALNEIKDDFEKEHPNIKINYNFGASGALQQQISQGAPVDLFFSATEDKFDQLVRDGLIDKDNSVDLVGNELVLVVPKGSAKGIKTLADITKADKISLGTPESVPAGKYAKQTLENLKVWENIESKVIYAKDVRQVLTYVETGNVDAGFVYKTDALMSKKVEVVATAAENTHEPIIYPVGVIKETAHPKEAQLFFDYLQTEKSLKILKKYGFIEI
ncbi:molybdate ABC transporter substrate-binding protein [Neobacillus niacini]|uniref:molybdate ABC transporter substrate-binding protein n=1 Tax=Neobacillus niacini TaxID=86668 RepID=UPI0021CB0AD8|nr:molybdate ABC transporter substrate-binding protein [Neobacillus niacini]MCM3765109.1 molybdate ABC transporter substrate-binding protein [Neobacillus niacini]